MVETIRWSDGVVEILDQAMLPHEVKYIRCSVYGDVVRCIKELNIRGAPAIGIAAAMGIALASMEADVKGREGFDRKIGIAIDALLASRPTAVNIRWACERMKALLQRNADSSVEELKGLLLAEAQGILREDIEINRQIGFWGAQFIKDGSRILTHCNAGALATGGYGTATAPMRQAIAEGKRIHVYADETRPVLQGARLTTWELMEDGIPVTLICDNSAGALMKAGEIDLCIVGTDRTVRNGDVANKIGTYTVAVLASVHALPFYVAAPFSSIDFTLSSGDYIPIEERNGAEVTNVTGKCQIAPNGVKVKNMAFDVTPAKYVTAIITENGAFKPADLEKLAAWDVNFENFRIKA